MYLVKEDISARQEQLAQELSPASPDCGCSTCSSKSKKGWLMIGSLLVLGIFWYFQSQKTK